MPNMNGTGPEGQGPMTGRKMGKCAGNTAKFQLSRCRRRRKCQDQE